MRISDEKRREVAAVSYTHLLALDWSRRQKRIDADDRARGKPTASEVEAATFRPTRTPEEALAEQERRWASEHPGIDPAKVDAPRGTTASRDRFGLYQDAQRLLAARAACERLSLIHILAKWAVAWLMENLLYCEDECGECRDYEEFGL